MVAKNSIMDDWCASFIGKTMDVLVDGYDEEMEQFFGRTYAESPDIDGRVYFTADEPVNPGTFVTVRFTDTMDGELTGEMV